MAEVLQTLLRLFQNRRERRVTISGLDCAGKTTLLYKLKLGVVVQTIPTIGFNVETVQCPSKLSGGKLNMTCWDSGGCSAPSIKYIGRAYVVDAEAVIWVVDSADRDRIAESVEALEDMCMDHTTPLREDKGIPLNAPILILANKQDLPNALKPSEVAAYFKPVTESRLSYVAPTTNMAPLPESGLAEAFDWLKTVIDIGLSKAGPQARGTPLPNDSERKTLGNKSDQLSKLENYLSRAISDSPPEVFLRQFHAYNLPSWDHYTHIRIAFTVLTEHGRQRGKDIIFSGIEDYIRNSKQTTGRAFHITMTYFWIQIVHFGIRSVPPRSDDPEEITGKEQDYQRTMTVSSIQTEETLTNLDLDITDTLPEKVTINEDFCRFLILNPYVVDGNLWAEYYSKEVMMSPEAKEKMVLPDKKPLPNLVVSDAISGRKDMHV